MRPLPSSRAQAAVFRPKCYRCNQVEICLIADSFEVTAHPVIGAALRDLRSRHAVRLLDVSGLSSERAVNCGRGHPLADIYLLKSHAAQALELARDLEQRGACVVNSFASSAACQDRALMAQRMREARLAFPCTWVLSSLAEFLQHPDRLSAAGFPVLVKSRYSRRGDVVEKVDGIEQLCAVAHRTGEPVVMQEFVRSDGWDAKLWVIDREIFAARRRSSLAGGAPRENCDVPISDFPGSWRSMTLEVGRAFGLRLYGVDFVVSDEGPVIVDVNSFPGFRGAAGAAAALVCLIERMLEYREVTGERARDAR